MRTRHWMRLIGHTLFVVAFLGIWEWSAASGLLDPTFFGRPSGIGAFLVKGFVTEGKLWLELGYTLAGAAISFAAGSIAAITVGLVFAMLRVLDLHVT